MHNVVAGATEPGNVERLVVIVVVGLQVAYLAPAPFADCWTLKSAALYGSLGFLVRSMLVGV